MYFNATILAYTLWRVHLRYIYGIQSIHIIKDNNKLVVLLINQKDYEHLFDKDPMQEKICLIGGVEPGQLTTVDLRYLWHKLSI